MMCPCHSGKEYSACCAPYHEGVPPPTPTDLMRSRYSAYALGKVEYIIATTHSEHSDQKLSLKKREQQIKTFCNSTEFTGLDILEATENTVTFRAYLGKKGSFTEKSEFAQENGVWKYKKALSLA